MMMKLTEPFSTGNPLREREWNQRHVCNKQFGRPHRPIKRLFERDTFSLLTTHANGDPLTRTMAL